jgi:hypothetical protein
MVTDRTVGGQYQKMPSDPEPIQTSASSTRSNATRITTCRPTFACGS